MSRQLLAIGCAIGETKNWSPNIGGMRPRVPWMNEVDDAVLEFLNELDIDGKPVALKPGAVHYNLVEQYNMIDKSLSTFSRRMSLLSEHGLLKKTEGGKGSPYRITDKGRAYLEGEIDVDDLKR